MRSKFVSTAEAANASGAAVVIDVMRAFTTAAWALHLGAARILLVRDLDEALALKAQIPGSLAFCDGAPRPGFDLQNSPVQVRSLDVEGRTIVQRTTAGTQGAVAARRCTPLVCTGFATATATASYLEAAGAQQVTFVVTGGDEDQACAEHIAALLDHRTPDPTLLDRAAASPAAADLHEGVRLGYTGVDQDDVALCLAVDTFKFAMTVSPDHSTGQLSLTATQVGQGT
jgi:2-phosphosulfolactate phosphatase